MKKILTLALGALFILPLAGCAQSEPDTSPYFFAMAADAAYIIPSEVRKSQAKNCYALYAETRSLLNEIDRSISSTVSTSYISKFNAAEAGAKVELDSYAYDVFSLALELYNETDGYYNPAVYYNVQAYGFGGSVTVPDSAEDLPSDELISKYNTLAQSFGELVLSEENGRYYAVKPSVSVEIDGATYSMKVDLGGIGKGYAVDKADALMTKHKLKYGYFTFGESSIAFKRYNGESSDSYVLGLSCPRLIEDKSRYYIQTKVKNACISTSGDNVQYYVLDGVRYCHIIDPTTGKPVQTGVMSATVIGATAARSDAYTTAIMAMGKERAVGFINEYLSDAAVYFTYFNGESYEIITNASGYEITNDSYTVVNRVEDGRIVY